MPIRCLAGQFGEHDVEFEQQFGAQCLGVRFSDVFRRKFDEHKIILGAQTLAEAEDLYRGGFSDGSGGQRMGAVTEMDITELQSWLEKGDTRKPLTYSDPGAVLPSKATGAPTSPNLPLVDEAPPQVAGGASPLVELSRTYEADIDAGTLTASRVQQRADQAFGGTLAEGAYDWREAYDAMELAINRRIMQDTQIQAGEATTAAQVKANVGRLESEILSKIPTQTRRTGEQVSFQQFSTPPTYAHVAAWAASIRGSDVILEPSAGTGSLAIYGTEGAQTFANELAPRRADALRRNTQGWDAQVQNIASHVEG